MEVSEKIISFSQLKDLYEKWDLRVVILFSLFLQIFLIFSAPLRKRTSNGFVVLPMWLAYLLADTTANFAVGLIASTSSDQSENGRILNAFWAAFLLVHLGGPDTITAFALEDNELWLRHLLQLIFQCLTTGYIFFLAFSSGFHLWFAALLVLIVGFIKYIERTRSLYLGSSNRLRKSSLGEPDAGPSYNKLVEVFFTKQEANMPTRVEIIAPQTSRLPNERKMPALSDLEILKYAHRFFQLSKGLIADLVLSFDERNESRMFFHNRNSKDAFSVIEAELNFFYEILYTKAKVVQSLSGYALRCASFSLTTAALVFFYLVDKSGFNPLDVVFTYVLFGGAISLDMIAFLMVLFSNWTAIALSDSESSLMMFLGKVLQINRERWPQESDTSNSRCLLLPFRWSKKILRRRWCKSICQYSLIDYILNPRSPKWGKFVNFFGLESLLDGNKYIEKVKWGDDMRDFIFKEIKVKSKLADDLETRKALYMARGDWVLRFEGCPELLPWVSDIDFDESLLTWHVATELCFCWQLEDGRFENFPSPNEKKYHQFAKLLSDYLLYLLIIKSSIMSSVAGLGLKRFRDTVAEAQTFFSEKNFVFDDKKQKSKKRLEVLRKKACSSIIQVRAEFKPAFVKGDGSKSVLFDGCILAKKLCKLNGPKWELICKVWIEMLCYAACRCRGTTHAAQLGKGGEPVTLVWLLMAHFGLGNQFQISDFQPRTALAVDK